MIENDDVGAMLEREPNGGFPIIGLGADAPVRPARKSGPYTGSNDRMIVRNYDFRHMPSHIFDFQQYFSALQRHPGRL